jgi:hypothetical protein
VAAVVDSPNVAIINQVHLRKKHYIYISDNTTPGVLLKGRRGFTVPVFTSGKGDPGKIFK